MQVITESIEQMNNGFPECFAPTFSIFRIPQKIIKHRSTPKPFFISNKLNMNVGKFGRKKFLFSNFKLITSIFLLEKKKAMATEKSLFNDNLQAYETKSGIQIIDFQSGNGEKPQWGSLLKVNYVTYIKIDQNIKKVDSTYDRNELFTFQHGSGELNIAFEEAIHSMKIGGERRIIYRINNDQEIFKSGPIPPLTGIRQEIKKLVQNSKKPGIFELIYDIQLVDIIDKKIK